MQILFYVSLLLIIFIEFVYLSSENQRTYNQLKDEDYHSSRVRNFFRKAVNLLSQERLYASVSFHGVGTFCKKDIKTNEIAMEISGNYTISTYDNYFPYFNEILPVLIKQIEANRTNMMEINQMRFILNLNYLRYVNNTNRFFKIYFDNLPKYKDFLPYWETQEKTILKKLMNDPLIDQDLLFYNTTNFDILLEDIKAVLKKIDPNLPSLMMTDNKLEEAQNVANSRTFEITKKGHKIIHSRYTDIDEEDLNDIGYILVPGADAINHKTIQSEHRDTDVSSVRYEKGNVVIRASRKFKMGEEFTINYEAGGNVYEMFKRYGFVPIEALYKNMIFKNDAVDMSDSPVAGRLVCLALGACVGPQWATKFQVPKFTNQISMARLVIERLNNWIGPPFTEEKMIEIYQQIWENRHSNITEGIALSKFAYSYYGFLLYSTNFKTSISNLVSMYEANEKKLSVKQIFIDHSLDKKIKIIDEPYELHDRFREILKYSLINHHVVALNTRESIIRLNTTLDNLINELSNEIIEQTS